MAHDGTQASDAAVEQMAHDERLEYYGISQDNPAARNHCRRMTRVVYHWYVHITMHYGQTANICEGVAILHGLMVGRLDDWKCFHQRTREDNRL